MNPAVFIAVRMPPELQPLQNLPYTLYYGDALPPDLPPAARDSVRALITNGSHGASRVLIEYFPRLELIASLGIGVDAIDFTCTRARGIRVTNTPRVIADDVADLAMAMILDRMRNIREANAFLLRGDWLKGAFPLAHTATGRRLGILGMGAIGQQIAARAAGFRMQVAWHGPRPKPQIPLPHVAELTELARNVDILVVSCSGGPATHHLVNARVLDALGPQGLLVNVARGSVVDTNALIAALHEGRLGAAALDVYEDEPHVPEALLQSGRVLLTPHLGSGTHETRRRMGELALASLADHFAGRVPANLVDPR